MSTGISKIIGLWLFFTVATTSTTVMAEPGFPTVRIGYVDFPPLTYTDENGAPAGTLNALSQRVLSEAGIPHQFVELPAKRIAHYISSGEIHLFQGIADIPEPGTLETAVLSSRAQLGLIHLAAYYLPGTPPVEHYQDLSGASVVTLLGYSYGNVGRFIHNPDSQVRTLAVSERESAFGMLKKARVDYFLDYSEPAEFEIDRQNLTGFIKTELAVFTTHWIVSKAYPHAERLRRALDRTYLELERPDADPVDY